MASALPFQAMLLCVKSTVRPLTRSNPWSGSASRAVPRDATPGDGVVDVVVDVAALLLEVAAVPECLNKGLARSAVSRPATARTITTATTQGRRRLGDGAGKARRPTVSLGAWRAAAGARSAGTSPGAGPPAPRSACRALSASTCWGPASLRRL